MNKDEMGGEFMEVKYVEVNNSLKGVDYGLEGFIQEKRLIFEGVEVDFCLVLIVDVVVLRKYIGLVGL